MGRFHLPSPPERVRASLGPPGGLQSPPYHTGASGHTGLPWAVSLGPASLLHQTFQMEPLPQPPREVGRGLEAGGRTVGVPHSGTKTLCHGPGTQAGGSVGLGSVHDHLPWSVKEGCWTGVGAKARSVRAIGKRPVNVIGAARLAAIPVPP